MLMQLSINNDSNIINVDSIQINRMFAEDQYYDCQVLRDSDNILPSYRQSKKESSTIKDYLNKINQEHNSEDEGIEDYVIGGYHPVHIGEVLLKRYVVIQKLGWGHFSTVWLCKDFKHKSYVAIKIQKSSPHYTEAAFDEVEILQKVEMHYKDPNWDGEDRDGTHVVGLLNAFIHKTYYGNHFCMVFEILRCNLLDIIKRYDYEGLPLDICQEISRQVLKGLDYLHRVCGVIHTDLKPENVMLCLTNQEVQEIVENGQLKNNELFAERTRLIQDCLGIQRPQENQSKTNKVVELQEKLKKGQLTKNQKKNLKKKIKKHQQKQNQEETEERGNGNYSQAHEVSGKTVKEEKVDKRFEELFDLSKGKMKLNGGGKLRLPLKVKIGDLGNACWKHHHFSREIQTRQYRSPEVILGQTYNETADMWSFGCMMYEMLTGDLLFQPRKSEEWGKNADHLAQMQELLGSFHLNFISRTPNMKKYFHKNGTMKKFPHLNHYSLNTVLQLKNKINPLNAKKFSDFLLPTFIPEPEKRATAAQMLRHDWLSQEAPHQNFKMSESEHGILKKRFYEDEGAFRMKGKEESDCEASCEDNDEENEVGLGKELKKYKMADIRVVDRSFTDLGYVGYCEGIDLQRLDSCKNWQFS